MDSKTSHYIIGLTSLFLVIVLWVVSSFTTKIILEDFNRPFLLTFLSCFSFQTYFIFCFFGDPIIKNALNSKDTISELETAKIALKFFPLYFLANYFSNLSFSLTSVGSATILASTCGFFTLIIGSLFKTEKFTLLKLFATLLSFCGVVCLSLNSYELAHSRFLGNVSALLGAILYGCYSVFLKRVDEDRIHMPTLFAFSGLFSLFILWPFSIMLDFLAIEPIKSANSSVLKSLCFNVIIGSLIPSYLWNVAFVFTSPLAVALGISCNIPLTLVVEHFLYSYELTLYKIISACFIIMGFIIINFEVFRKKDTLEKVSKQ